MAKMNGGGNDNDHLARFQRRIDATREKVAAERELLRKRIANEAIAASLKGGPNEISFKDLKRKAGTVIPVCLPLAEFSVSDKWLRVLAATMITDTLNEGLSGKGAPVVAILDEVYECGYLKVDDKFGSEHK